MKQSSLRIICDRNINASPIGDLITKNGNKALFILRNRPYFFVAENWTPGPITGPTNEAYIFRYYSGENSVEQSITLHV